MENKKLLYVTPKANIEITMPKFIFDMFTNAINVGIVKIKVKEQSEIKEERQSVIVFDEFDSSTITQDNK